jgi:uncharacterized membrane protein YesL
MAGFFGFFDYTKPGKGVDKEEYKPNLGTFFRILLERFWKLLQLNLMYVICSVPLLAVMLLYMPVGLENQDEQMIQTFQFCVGALLYLSVVGFAPVITGFTYVLRNYARDSHAWVFSDFFEQIKKNFKQAAGILAIDALCVLVIPFLYAFYSNVLQQPPEGAAAIYRNAAFIARTLIIIASAVYFIMHFYMFQILVTFDMKLKQIYKNSLIFALAHMPRNLGILLLIGAVAVLTFGFTAIVGVLLSLLISVSLIGYIVNFTVQPVISKHMIAPSGE